MNFSFHANAATRMHPTEWTTGLAAGIAASIMAEFSVSSAELYQDHVLLAQLQDMIAENAPLEWTFPTTQR